MVSSSNNDERIIKLKELIIAKRKELGTNKKFMPVTNCLLDIDGASYNLHVDKHNCVVLLLKLEALRDAAERLDVDPDDVRMCGFSLTDWITDVKNVIEVEKYKKEKAKLDRLEKQLMSLLSDDKQTELMIDEIEGLL